MVDALRASRSTEATLRAGETTSWKEDERGELAWFVGTVAAAALLMRALYLLSIQDAPFFSQLQTEPARYDAWALDIVRGVAPFRPPLDEAPGYPYFVAAIFAAFGHRIIAVAAVQAVLDAWSAGAVALVARRLLGERAGWIAGGILAAYGPLVYFTAQLEPATLAVFAVSIAMACTPTSAAPARAWTWAAVAWAVAILVRSELVLAAPIVVWHAARTGGRSAAWRMLTGPGTILAVSLGLNLAASGHLVFLTTGGGVNAWIGNNPSADGVSPFVHGPMLGVTHDVEVRAADAVEADRLFTGHALAFVRSEPARATHLLFRRLVWLFTDRELPNAADIEWQMAQSWLFTVPLLPLRFGPVFAAALAGLVARRRELVRARFLLAPIAVAVAVAAVFFTNARFRLVMCPTLALVAAGFVDHAIGLVRSPASAARTRAFFRLGAALALGSLITFTSYDDVRAYRIPEIDANTRLLRPRRP